MGLAVTVGNPCVGYDEEGEAHYRQEFGQLSVLLRAHGHTWSAPGEPPAATARPHVSSFPAGCLHHLRRVAALLAEGRAVTPVSDYDEVRSDDDVVADATSMFSSHLLCHSDGSGYYVPVDLGDPLFVDADAISGAGMIGSSRQLREELARIAPAIGVRLDADGRLDDAEAARLLANADDPGGEPFAVEQMVWLTLHEACRVSIDSGHAIVFH